MKISIPFGRYSFYIPLFLALFILPNSAFSQVNLPPHELKKLSVEELMDIEVTLVSKRPEKLSEAASAIQVITREDILRSGATNLPEALRLAPNLQTAQLNSYGWIISARGFNTIFANKLLVMIDGRTVYTPLFAGVYWDIQNVLLEDINRIEIISGPGGTLWGANAVNGIINIITKHATQTQGLYASGATGSFFRNSGAVRYGNNIGSKFSYRVFAQLNDRSNTLQSNGRDSTDRWNMVHAGFYLDYNPSEKNTLTLQGNFYGGTEYTKPEASTLDGQNVIARWTHSRSSSSDLALQVYVDRTWRRDIPSTFSDELDTYDADLQHHFHIRKKHNFIWGAGYRFMRDKSQHSTLFVGFVPEKRDMGLVSSFLQDEITLLPDRLKLTLGTKFLRNAFTGFEIQPGARLAWTPDGLQTLWTAVSRAVRTPSRIDVDYRIPTYPVPPGTPNVAGGPNFDSEKVIAYELGYRIQPTTGLSLSLATFYNEYNDVYSVEALADGVTFQIQNGSEGNSWGLELSGLCQVVKAWRLRGGYTYFNKTLASKPGHNFDPAYLGNDPKSQVLLQSMIDLPGQVQVDLVARHVSSLPQTLATPQIPAYTTLSFRISWAYRNFEISLTGQNILENRHSEFGLLQIPRNVYGKVTYRLLK